MDGKISGVLGTKEFKVVKPGDYIVINEDTLKVDISKALETTRKSSALPGTIAACIAVAVPAIEKFASKYPDSFDLVSVILLLVYVAAFAVFACKGIDIWLFKRENKNKVSLETLVDNIKEKSIPVKEKDTFTGTFG